MRNCNKSNIRVLQILLAALVSVAVAGGGGYGVGYGFQAGGYGGYGGYGGGHGHGGVASVNVQQGPHGYHYGVRN